MHTRADFEPCGRDDDGIDERPLDAVIRWRLVALVDDADRYQHHPCAHVEAARQQKIDVGLFELELSGFFEPFDQRVLELQLADETDAVAEAMRDQQDEAVKVETPVREFLLVEMEVHVARDRRRALGRWGRWRLASSARRRRAGAGRGRGTRRAGEPHVLSWLQNVANTTFRCGSLSMRRYSGLVRAVKRTARSRSRAVSRSEATPHGDARIIPRSSRRITSR